MIHVGGSAGVFDLVPMSSSIRNRQYWQFDTLALGLPSLKRSRMNEPVLTYHAWSSLRR